MIPIMLKDIDSIIKGPGQSSSNTPTPAKKPRRFFIHRPAHDPSFSTHFAGFLFLFLFFSFFLFFHAKARLRASFSQGFLGLGLLFGKGFPLIMTVPEMVAMLAFACVQQRQRYRVPPLRGKSYARQLRELLLQGLPSLSRRKGEALASSTGRLSLLLGVGEGFGFFRSLSIGT